jgi:ABC-type sugar transport system ATPase subunit
MADRIVIMRAGGVVGEISGAEADQEKILEYATSGTEENGVKESGEGD